MQLPYFYSKQIGRANEILTLEEETSKHIVGVLRMKTGEQLHLTDGQGNIAVAEIVNDHKKKCETEIKTITHQPVASRKVSIAVSLLKNASRFEWFLEKATEIGAASIIPLICERTEREHFRKDRMEGVLISAMLQSRQSWLPKLSDPVAVEVFLNNKFDNTSLFIAHCDEQHKQSLTSQQVKGDALICIGPEGDFSKEEIELALQRNYIPVSLGDTRLRTETAAIVAAALLRIR